MKPGRRFQVIAIALVALVGVGLILPAIITVTNCGGNSAALSQVKGIFLIAQASTREASDTSFAWSGLDPDARASLAMYTHLRWSRNARFLVYTGPIAWDDTQSSRPIVICDTPFNNVPRHWFWSAPMTHAAAFTDGSTRLMSVGEYARLDLNDYIAVDQLPSLENLQR